LLRLLRPTPPDLLLLDIRMPGMDVHEALRRVTVELGVATPPAIAVTANLAQDDIAGLARSGFWSYVAKPYLFTTLARAIRDALQPGTEPYEGRLQ
jgi:CheY-like chemotaxis protein